MLLHILFSCLVQEADVQLTVDELVSLHQVSVRSIQEVDFVLEVYSGQAFDLGEILRYSSDGVSERLRTEAVRFPADQPKRFVDIVRDEEQSSRLEGQDPAEKKSIADPFEAHGMAGARLRPAEVESSFRVLSSLNLRFSVDTLDRHRQLAELVADARVVHGDDAVAMLPKAVVQGVSCYHLRIRHPSFVNVQTGMREHETSELHLFLDPMVGYLAHRVEVHRRRTPGDTLYVITKEATEFKKFPDGVFFPMVVVGTDLYGDKNALPANPKCEFRVSNLTLNEALPEDAMDFCFPENLLISDTATTESPVLVWVGKDNEPLRTFHSNNDLDEFLATRQVSANATKRHLTIGIVVFNACILGGVYLWIRRRRMRRAI